MASDPNLNRGGACRNPMSTEHNLDFTDLYQNEESFDLTTYMSAGNLELCSDDLFENLFPPNSPLGPDPKKETINDFEDELDSWYNPVPREPQSNCASACSSAAPSPVPFNYYNTPPVTPQADKHRPVSPHHLQFDGLTTPMSTSRFSSKRGEEPKNAFTLPNWSEEPKNNYASKVPFVLPAPDPDQYPNGQVIVKPDPDAIQSPCPLPSVSVKDEMQASPKPFVVSRPDTNLNNKSPLKRISQSPSLGGSSKKSKTIQKGTLEYVQKRERNNVAVRRSRDKAKVKAMETQKKVEELSSENSRLHDRVNELSHELTTLKNLLKSLHQVNG
uniref:C/EBPalpha/gamma CCAAT enhancer binding protein alpha/gamma homolog n=1 Tax=Phallusia mammillata TaxID=59560 RepID=A0A6F9D9I4_9ASCI|nr:C/EBPalpha/gamma CCAAT enhancer binding protein alpha/gamma homolog [Phallusia mammillata]